MWMWSDIEKLHKLIKSVQKWLEFQSKAEDIPEKALEIGFVRATKNAIKIVKELGLEGDETRAFIQSWVEIGIFAGFIAGWRNSKQILTNGGLPTLAAVLDDSYVINQADFYAKKFASETAEGLFSKLLDPPVSPLLDGLEEKQIELLKISHESSLYAGFLDGVEQSYRSKDKTNSLFGF